MRLIAMQAQSTPKPNPDRRRVLLASAGTAEPTFTIHTYVDSVLEPDPEHGWLWPQWALNFRCTKTGAVRKFGVVDATDRSETNRKLEIRGLA